MPVKERPILFNTEMVKAILDGRKTMTRRVIKPQPYEGCGHIRVEYFYPTKIDRHGEEYPGDKIFGAYSLDGEWGCKCPYGQVGDRLWVRETWDYTGQGLDCVYKADAKPTDIFPWEKYKPSIFMPRWASRITLEITGIRAERLWDITEDDAFAEGVNGGCLDCGYPQPCKCIIPNPSYTDSFIYLWDSINTKRGHPWANNDWTWPISFRRVDHAATD